MRDIYAADRATTICPPYQNCQNIPRAPDMTRSRHAIRRQAHHRAVDSKIDSADRTSARAFCQQTLFQNIWSIHYTPNYNSHTAPLKIATAGSRPDNMRSDCSMNKRSQKTRQQHQTTLGISFSSIQIFLQPPPPRAP